MRKEKCVNLPNFVYCFTYDRHFPLYILQWRLKVKEKIIRDFYYPENYF